MRLLIIYSLSSALPAIAGVALRDVMLQNFRETMAASMNLQIFFNVLFAGIIAFGVVYNSARVSLSERARELASLRVLGFTRAEISLILLGELAMLTLVALPVGAVLLAVLSSLRNRPLPEGLVVFGEVGLAGEIRPVPNGQDRLKEAAKLGFSVAVVPKANAPKKNDKAFEGLTWDSPYGKITMRSDHQAVHGAMIGMTKFNPKYGFATLDNVKVISAEEIMPPVGVKSPEWIATLKK